MITAIENSALWIMIAFIIFSTLLSIYNFSIEFIFRQRKKICYQNYSFYRKLYNYKLNEYNLIGLVGVLAFSVLIFALFIASAVVRWYLFVLIPVDFTIGVFLYYEITRQDYNNPFVLEFDDYYINVKNVEASKTRLIEQINELILNYDNKTKQLITAINEYNEIYPHQSKLNELLSLVEKYREEFIQNKEDLNNYNNSLVNQFNENISEYVIQGLNPSFEIPEFQQVDITKLNQFLIEIEDSFKNYINDTYYQNLINNPPKIAKTLIKLFDVLSLVAIKLDYETIIALLNIANDKIQDKSKIIEYLLPKQIVDPFKILNYCIQKDWDWAFTSEVLIEIKNIDLIKLYIEIVNNNSINCCNVFLKETSIDQSDVYERVLSSTSENNTCVQMIKFRRILKNNSMEFDDPINKYENMAYALYQANLNKKNTQIYKTIKLICENEKFIENAAFIETEYDKAKTNLLTKYNMLSQVLMCFYEGELANSEILDINKIINFYMESIKTVNEDAIRYLNLLLSAMVLRISNIQESINTAVKALSSYKIMQSLQPINKNNAKETAKKIIRFMISNRRSQLIAVLNRIEKKRLSFNDISKL